MSDFTMNGRLKVYFEQPYLVEKALSPVWYGPVEPSRDVLHNSPQSRRMTSSGSVGGIGVGNLLFDSSK
jgi:hypothetical protein